MSLRPAPSHSLFLVLSTLFAGALAMASCSSDDSTVFGAGSTGTGGQTSSASAMGGNVQGPGGNGGNGGKGGSQDCASDDDCKGGVCNKGTCCESASLACGDGCCTSGQACLFETCVTPGKPCVSQADCPDKHYCEPALGDNGQGGSNQGGDCSQPLEYGRCVPLPPLCSDMPNDKNCVDKCEYFPTPGQLNAVEKWQWGASPEPSAFKDKADIWATPSVARVVDANCDGKVDLGDPPNVVFVSGDSKGTCCSCGNANPSTCLTGVLRVLDGKSGEEIWSLDKAGPNGIGFAGTSVALGDVNQDQLVEIVALTGEGYVAIINSKGQVLQLSSERVDGYNQGAFGWGGGLALGDMNNDGWPEIAYGRSVFTMEGGTLQLKFKGTAGDGGGLSRALAHFVDLDGDGSLELLAGRTAYKYDGSMLWNNSSNNGFTAVADFDADGTPEVVVVSGGALRILDGATGNVELGPVNIPGSGSGGPPTVADFNGDSAPEIGVATANFYSMFKPDYQANTIQVLWSATNHDNSSSVTGSSVFDFEGDGKAEVIYMDECFLWVYDGATGNVIYTANTQSFTATEASIVADVDGDGHAEMMLIANGANPVSWTCAHHTSGTDGYPTWQLPTGVSAYRGITVLGDKANSWVGTRTLWNQHAYSVTNICDPRDSACMPGSYYGQIPTQQQKNWQQNWLNNFRQNVQDEGLFNAPDATISLRAECAQPVPLVASVRNFGQAGLPANVNVAVYAVKQGGDVVVATGATSKPLLPGQTEELALLADAMLAGTGDTFYARIVIDPNNITFNECRDDNNESSKVTPNCVQ